MTRWQLAALVPYVLNSFVESINLGLASCVVFEVADGNVNCSCPMLFLVGRGCSVGKSFLDSCSYSSTFNRMLA
jgi:hypothetical protein